MKNFFINTSTAALPTVSLQTSQDSPHSVLNLLFPRSTVITGFTEKPKPQTENTLHEFSNPSFTAYDISTRYHGEDILDEHRLSATENDSLFIFKGEPNTTTLSKRRFNRGFKEYSFKECPRCSHNNLITQNKNDRYCFKCGTALEHDNKTKVKKIKGAAIFFAKINGIETKVSENGIERSSFDLSSRRFDILFEIAKQIAKKNGVFLKFISGNKIMFVAGLDKPILKNKDSLDYQKRKELRNLRIIQDVTRQYQSILEILNDQNLNDIYSFEGIELPNQSQRLIFQNTKLSMFGAIESGDIVFGEVGFGSVEHTAIGTAVNSCARHLTAGIRKYKSELSSTDQYNSNGSSYIFTSQKSAEILSHHSQTSKFDSQVYMKGLGLRDVYVVSEFEKNFQDDAITKKTSFLFSDNCAHKQSHHRIQENHCIGCGKSHHDFNSTNHSTNGLGVFVTFDLAGYTKLSTGMEPSQVIQYLNDNFYREVEEVIIASGGKIIERNGDEIIAIYNINQRLIALKAIQEALKKILNNNSESQVRVGIAEGRFYTSSGHIITDAIHLAQQAQDQIDPGEVALDISFAKRVEKEVEFTALPESHSEQTHKVVKKIRTLPQLNSSHNILPHERKSDSEYLGQRLIQTLESGFLLDIYSGPNYNGKILAISEMIDYGLRSGHLQNYTILSGSADPYKGDALKKAISAFIMSHIEHDHLNDISLSEYIKDLNLELTSEEFLILIEYLQLPVFNFSKINDQNLADESIYQEKLIQTLTKFFKSLAINHHPIELILFNANHLNETNKRILLNLLKALKETPIHISLIIDSDTALTTEQFFKQHSPLLNELNHNQRFQDIFAKKISKESLKNILIKRLAHHFELSEIETSHAINEQLLDSYWKRSEEGTYDFIIILIDHDLKHDNLQFDTINKRFHITLDSINTNIEIDECLLSKVGTLSPRVQSLFNDIAILGQFDGSFHIKHLRQYHSQQNIYLLRDLSKLVELGIIVSLQGSNNQEYTIINQRMFNARYHQFIPKEISGSIKDIELEKTHHPLVDHLHTIDLITAKDYAFLSFHEFKSGLNKEMIVHGEKAVEIALNNRQYSEAFLYLKNLYSRVDHINFPDKLATKLRFLQGMYNIVDKLDSKDHWKFVVNEYDRITVLREFKLLDESFQKEILLNQILSKLRFKIFFESPSELRDFALEVEEEALILARGIEPKFLADLHRSFIGAFTFSGMPDKALEHFESTTKNGILDSLPLNVQARFNLVVSSFLNKIGDFDRSLPFINSAESGYEKIENVEYICYAKFNRSIRLIGLGHYGDALEILNKVLEIGIENQFPMVIIYSYSLIGNCFLKLMQYDQALKYFDKGIHFIGNNKSHPLYKVFTALQSICYFYLEQFQHSLKLLTQISTIEDLDNIDFENIQNKLVLFAIALLGIHFNKQNTFHSALEKLHQMRSKEKYLESIDEEFLWLYENRDFIFKPQADLKPNLPLLSFLTSPRSS